MADQDNKAQNGSTVAAPASNANAGNSDTTGSESKQPANAAVDNGAAEDKGKSAASDGQNGSDGADGGRQRPGRAQRTISELTKKVNELTTDLQKSQDIAAQLQQTPLDASKIQTPDYSQLTEVTPAQIRQDIINTAQQIVDLRMQSMGSMLEQKLTARQASDKSANAIADTIKKYPILNPDHEDYDQAFDQEITAGYADVLQKDPTYTFDRFIKPMERFLEQSNTTKQTNEQSNRGTAANRAGSQSRGQKPFDQMSTKEMEDWFAARRQ